MDSDWNKLVEKECIIIHTYLFGFKPSANIIQLYISLCNKYFPEKESTITNQIVSKNIDWESVEYAWRLKNKHNPISKKFKALTYICEGHSEYFTFFTNEKKSFLNAFLNLALIPFSTAYKFLKGKYWILYYGF